MPDLPEATPKSKKRFNVIRFEKRVTATFSILSRLFFITIILTAVVFVYRELSRDAFVIQSIQVPESLEEKGFNGNTIATRISRRLNDIIQRTNSLESATSYASASSQSDVAVEVVGIGLPVRAFIELVGNAVGIERNNKVRGEITIEGTNLVLELEVGREKPERFLAPLADDVGEPLKTLIDHASETILRYTNDETLNRYYANVIRNGQKAVELARFRVEKYAGDNRMEALVLASWGYGYLMQGKYEEALLKVDEGLKKSKQEALLYNVWGLCLLRQGKLEEAIEKLKMAFSLISERDPKYRGPAILTNTGLVFSRLKQPDSAIYYYERSIALDPTFSTAWYNLSIQRLFKGDTTRCFELLERSLVAGFNPNYIASDSDFAGLLEDPRMKQLLKKYEY
jgi:Flp pilus assembly protein TadD